MIAYCLTITFGKGNDCLFFVYFKDRMAVDSLNSICIAFEIEIMRGFLLLFFSF